MAEEQKAAADRGRQQLTAALLATGVPAAQAARPVRTSDELSASITSLIAATLPPTTAAAAAALQAGAGNAADGGVEKSRAAMPTPAPAPAPARTITPLPPCTRT